MKNSLLILLLAIVNFSIFAMDLPTVGQNNNNREIDNAQNQKNISAQNLTSSSDETSSMEIDSSSTGTKRRRDSEETLEERDSEEDGKESANLTKRQRIEIENQQDDQIENSKVGLLKNLAAKKIADYLANPSAFPNFKFNPAILHHELKDDIVHYLYKYHSNKVWDVTEKDRSAVVLPCSIDKSRIDAITALHLDYVRKEIFNISNNEKFITFTDDADLKIYELNTGFFRIYKTDDNDALLIARISPDSNFIVAGYQSGLVKIWDVDSGICLDSLNFYNPINSIEISRNGEFIVISDWDGLVKIWNPAEMKIYSVETSSDGPTAIKLSIDNKVVFIESTDYILIVDLTSGKILHLIPLDTDGETFVEFCPINNCIITYNTHTKDLEIWDGKIGQKMYSLLNRDFPILVSKDEKLLVTASLDEEILVIRDIKTGKCLKMIAYSGDELIRVMGILGVEMCLRDDKFVISYNGSRSEIWNFKSNLCLAILGPLKALSSDKKLIIAQDLAGLKIYDVESWCQCVQIIKLTNPMKNQDVNISKNNKFIILVDKEKISIWKVNLSSDEIINRLYSRLKNLQDLNCRILKLGK